MLWFHKLVHGEIEEVHKPHTEINAEIEQIVNPFDAGKQIFSHMHTNCAYKLVVKH